MNEAQCCLLIGNTRWHWAIKTQKKWEFIHSLPKAKENTSLRKALWKWAAVGPIPNDVGLQSSKQMTLKDIPLQKAPKWLGIDRALGGWGAFQKAKLSGLHSKGLLIADAGTVLSLTQITPKGEFAGGQLVAGLKLQRLAMAEKTHHLNYAKSNCLPNQTFPFTTDEAILRGSFQSLAGTLIEAQKMTKSPIWLCGGDSEILFQNLEKKLDITYSPNLVLETMITINS